MRVSGDADKVTIGGAAHAVFRPISAHWLLPDIDGR
jgi:hypothetical protein